MTVEEYLESRVDDQIKWYSSKATTNKRLHIWSRSIIIVFSVVIPLIAGLGFDSSITNITLGSLGTLIAIISGISALLKFQEKWTEYRITSQTLKHEKMLFLTKTSPFDNEEDAFNTLVTRIENLISKERSIWNQYINKEN